MFETAFQAVSCVQQEAHKNTRNPRICKGNKRRFFRAFAWRFLTSCFEFEQKNPVQGRICIESPFIFVFFPYKIFFTFLPAFGFRWKVFFFSENSSGKSFFCSWFAFPEEKCLLRTFCVCAIYEESCQIYFVPFSFLLFSESWPSWQLHQVCAKRKFSSARFVCFTRFYGKEVYFLCSFCLKEFFF